MEPKYDDREITFTETRKQMLSDLTEREREIFFSGVQDGWEIATKILTFIMFLMVVTVFLSVCCYKYQWI